MNKILYITEEEWYKTFLSQVISFFLIFLNQEIRIN